MTFREENIGDARLVLADSLDVLPTFDQVDHTISDPPYEALMHAAKNGARGPTRIDQGPALRGLDFYAIDDIRSEIVALCGPVTKGWFIAFCTPEGVARWADVINPSPIRYKRACIWVKPDSTPQLNGQGPAMGAECFVTAWCGKGYSRWNAGGKRGVYTHLTNPSDRHGEHPTEKPWRLMSEILTDFTKPGETVLDPFMGSGTTGVACAKLGRKFIGIEIEPRYFDIACKRIEEAYRQGDFFVAPCPNPKQDALPLETNTTEDAA